MPKIIIQTNQGEEVATLRDPDMPDHQACQAVLDEIVKQLARAKAIESPRASYIWPPGSSKCL